MNALNEVEVSRLVEHANAKHVTYELDGRSRRVPMATRCHTCRSRYRAKIERLLLEGQPPTAIVRHHLPKDAGLKPANIAEHHRRDHIAAEDEIARRILKEQADAHASRIDADATTVITERRLAETIVQRTWDAITAGELRPTMKDGIQASRLLAQRDPIVLERKKWRNEARRSHAATVRLLDIVYDTVDDDQWNAICHAVNDDDDLIPFVAHVERSSPEARSKRRRQRQRR
jgi:hypothetical protein